MDKSLTITSSAVMAAILNFEVKMNSKLKFDYFIGLVMTILVGKDTLFVILSFLVAETLHFENYSLNSAAILFLHITR